MSVEFDDYDERGRPGVADERACIIGVVVNPGDQKIIVSYARPGNAIVKRHYRAPARTCSLVQAGIGSGRYAIGSYVYELLNFILDDGGTFVDEEINGISLRYGAERNSRHATEVPFNAALPPTPPLETNPEVFRRPPPPPPPGPFGRIRGVSADRIILDDLQDPPFVQQVMGEYDPSPVYRDPDTGEVRVRPGVDLSQLTAAETAQVTAARGDIQVGHGTAEGPRLVPHTVGPDGRTRPEDVLAVSHEVENPCVETDLPMVTRMYQDGIVRPVLCFADRGNGTYCLKNEGHDDPHNSEGRVLGRLQPEVMVSYVVDARLKAICRQDVTIGRGYGAHRIARAVEDQVPFMKATVDENGMVTIIGRPLHPTVVAPEQPPANRAQLEALYRNRGSRLPERMRETSPAPQPFQQAVAQHANEIVRHQQAAEVRTAAEALELAQQHGLLNNMREEIRTTDGTGDLAPVHLPVGSVVLSLPEMVAQPAAGSLASALQEMGQAMQQQVADTGPAQAPHEWEGGTVELYDENHAHQEEDPIFTWEVQSDRVGKGGRRPKYTLVLYADGCASCDCPGWIYKRSNKPRGCKHIDLLAAEIRETYRRHLRGETLEAPRSEAELPAAAPRREDGRPLEIRRYGRTLDL